MMTKQTIADLGPMMQIAYVTDDLEAATLYWTKTMGVGPFFHLVNSPANADRFLYQGKPCEAEYLVRIAYWGDMQVELIQQTNDAPSIYTEWRAGEHFHHSCVTVIDMDEALGICSQNGATLLQEGQYGEARFAYLDTGRGPGSILELLLPTPEVAERYERFRDIARNWNGQAPVRPWVSV